jgi:signal transduction histidine kinase
MDLAQVLVRTVELLEPIADRSSVQLALEVDPDRQSPAIVHADANQLQQVFTNILVNAIQAMPQGGRVRIELTRSDSGQRIQADPESRSNAAADYWKVSIIDQGMGISPEHLAHVFEPFFTTKDVNEGTGLGLSIAYGIVQEHHGWIDVASRLNEGSRFDVYLPREPD